jgi:hypothetical protein
MDVDFTDLFPIKSVHEYSKFLYKLHSAEEWTSTPELAFTENWTAMAVHDVVSRPGSNIVFLSAGYNAAVLLPYVAAVPTYLGSQIIGSYAILEAPSGLIYYCGYSNQFAVYNPDEPWTLTNANGDPVGPADGDAWTSRPNPYLIKMDVAPLLHYRTCLDYDANGLIWQGGTTTRLGTNIDFGNVMWYDPSDSSTGYVFDSWETTEPTAVKFGYLCAAVNRTKICASDHLGNIWIIDAATKTVGETPIRPVDADGRNFMVEVAPDVVVGIYMTATASESRIYRFQPSTGTILTVAQELGVAGQPFGWTSSEENRFFWKPKLGPDGYVWMYVGNTLYRVHPATLAFSSIDATGTYGKITFTNGGRDLLWYGYNTSVKYYPNIFARVDAKLVGGVVAGKVGGVTAEKVGGVQQ